MPEHAVRGGGKSPKNGVKYKKQTLSVQLLRGRIMPQSPVNSDFLCLWCHLAGGDTPHWVSWENMRVTKNSTR